MTGSLERLREVMAELRSSCPWDREQTHRSLLTHLVEETAEVIDAVEAGSDAELVEELGDLLLQVYFHAQIAAEEGRFTLDDVADGITDKLVRRHPHVFAGESVPEDMHRSWEDRKRREKQRRSALDGIPDSLNALAKAQKVVSRARSHRVPLALDERPVTTDELSDGLVSLVARAQASGIDADQVLRDAVRSLEGAVRTAEGQAGPAGSHDAPVG